VPKHRRSSPRTKRGIQKHPTRRVLQLLHSQYQRDRNPLWVWKAYDIARTQRHPPPAWVLKYFDQVAVNLEYLSFWRPPRRGKIAGSILRACGFVADGRNVGDGRTSDSSRDTPDGRILSGATPSSESGWRCIASGWRRSSPGQNQKILTCGRTRQTGYGPDEGRASSVARAPCF
jgi:hypothetical protein